jgi:hypothetical protein
MLLSVAAHVLSSGDCANEAIIVENFEAQALRAPPVEQLIEEAPLAGRCDNDPEWGRVAQRRFPARVRLPAPPVCSIVW